MPAGGAMPAAGAMPAGGAMPLDTVTGIGVGGRSSSGALLPGPLGADDHKSC